MMTFSARSRIGVALALAALSAACSNVPRPQTSVGAAQRTDPAEVEAIASLLDQGEQTQAGKRLKAALKRDPGNANLMLLSDSMNRDPIELLGPDNFPYIVQQGDTIPALAQRFLGNRLKAHQLARYNDLTGGAPLTAGRALRIPGQAPRVEAPKRPERQAEPTRAPMPRPVAAPAPRAAMASPQPAKPPTDPAAAHRARSAGLAALNEGKPARAVGLLTRAAALDPNNSAIARDLQRAQRINATVQARQ